MMLRMMHAADLHLDSPFAALAPEQAAQRRAEQRDMLRRLAAECERRDCQILLLAGDLFDSDRVYRETADLLRQTLQELNARVFIAPGNHDPYTPRSPYANLSWPDNVHIFRSRSVQAVRLDNPALTVYGAAFNESRESGLFGGFAAEAGQEPKIMVMHGTLGAAPSVYNPISEAAVSASGLDYLALGHVHRREIRRIGRTTVGNPGFAMGRGFDETGPGGALYLEMEGGDCRVEAVDLGCRIYQSLTVRVAEDPLAAAEAMLPEDTERDIYRIILTGSCQPPDLDALKAALAPRFYALELVDQTLPPLSLWKDLSEDSLKGEFLRKIKDCYDAEDTNEEARRLLARAAEIGLALMEGREVPGL